MLAKLARAIFFLGHQAYEEFPCHHSERKSIVASLKWLSRYNRIIVVIS